MSDLVGTVGELGARLRSGGVRVGVGETLAAHRALAAVDPVSRAEVYYGLRAVLCSGRGDFAAFDAAFGETFGEGRAGDGLAELMDAARDVLPRAGVPAAGAP
ncbi:MAG: hypothetical protein AVDCRST_MAG30-3444, partial [uncultured Solirubrobacteraceae bacterium]